MREVGFYMPYSGQGRALDSCEEGSEPSVYAKGREMLAWLRKY
jgi:hypothetical protein